MSETLFEVFFVVVVVLGTVGLFVVSEFMSVNFGFSLSLLSQPHLENCRNAGIPILFLCLRAVVGWDVWSLFPVKLSSWMRGAEYKGFINDYLTPSGRSVSNWKHSSQMSLTVYSVQLCSTDCWKAFQGLFLTHGRSHITDFSRLCFVQFNSESQKGPNSFKEKFGSVRRRDYYYSRLYAM